MQIDIMVLECKFFDFSLLPNVNVQNPEFVITLNDLLQSEISIYGNVDLNGTNFKLEMLKPFKATDYSI